MSKKDINMNYAFRLEPSEIVKYFESKGCKISFDWNEVYEDAHAKAFTVAKMTNADLLKDTQTLIDKAIKEGWSSQKFKKVANDLFAKNGWTGTKEVTDPKTGKTKKVELGTPRRIKKIFSCNMNSAYAVGRYKEQMEDVDFAPYFQYMCILDNRTRPEHKAMHGKVFRYDDPIWQTMYPPNGWNCRCFVNSLTPEDIKKQGLTVESSKGKLVEVSTIVGKEEKTLTGYDFNVNGRDFRLVPDAGWNTNLGMFDYIPDLEKYDNKVASQVAETLTNSKAFDNYYNKCQNLAKKIEAKAIKDLTINNISPKRGEIEKYAINNLIAKKYSKSLKDIGFNIAILTKEQQKLLKTNTKTVKLSVQTLLKEHIKHSDLSIEDFKAIPSVIFNANVLILEDTIGHLVYYKVGNNLVVLVVKSNKEKTSNFITTYHYTNKKELLKKLKASNTTIIFDNLNIKKE